MSTTKINDKILKTLAINCNEDENMFKFLSNLLFEEAEHPGQWWWKEIYKKNIEKYAKKEDINHED